MNTSSPQTTVSNAAIKPPRLYYIDWIRSLAMLGIFLFHNARFYDAFSDWHVKNAEIGIGSTALVAFMSQWIMPLFFLIAGAGAYYSLKSRSAGQFILERTLRLLVPLVFGILVIVVPQFYFDAVSHGERLAGLNCFQIYEMYLKTIPTLHWFHLWFLMDLFIFSIVALPLFLPGRNSGESIISRIASAFSKPWALMLLLVISLGIINTLLYPARFLGQRESGGWSFIAYFLFFILGYLIFANPRIIEGVKKYTWILLIIAIIALGCLLVFTDTVANPKEFFGTPTFIGVQFIQSINTWCWMLFFLGLASRYLNRNNRFLSYANEAVLPFYVLHQTVIISIGFYVVQWNIGVWLKYLTISTTSFIAIMLIYDLLVRRINVLRFLFGMRVKKNW